MENTELEANLSPEIQQRMLELKSVLESTNVFRA